ncbi:UxaA family hydrolase [Chelativorans sp. YIM 93263]|uniref:UxaA family hydrolase n=1 Tax=Chelativorans sp. YIM 93263 TaxID=2906648 RepID=UPI0023784D4C|nr:altronate dehydratase family protein [Chelativorans sp. YIM 93263]
MSTPVILSERDSVAILTARAAAGARPLGEGRPLDKPWSPGHKIARAALKPGAPIIKFGQVIGYATDEIAVGDPVHTHNCAFGAHDQSYVFSGGLEAATAAIPKITRRTFMGYAREDGQVGTRNFIALCATVNCSATVVRKAAQEIEQSGILEDWPDIDGVVAFAHGTGCGMVSQGEGARMLERVLWGHATHPNVAATLFVGLGCEVMQVARMRSRYGGAAEPRLHGLTIQETGGTRATVERIKEAVRALLPQVGAARRTEQSASALKVALQCGGSDGYSGITANPALGMASDRLVGLGASPVLAETPEIYGAEQLLLQRAASEAVAETLVERIRWWENYTAMHGGSMDNNPSPGNKVGGLTTILEKSLGAVAKGGSTPLVDVIDYAAPVTQAGLNFMDSPGYDPVSVTGQIAGGCQIVCFTTGRGSAFGSKPAPTIKLASNSELYRRMPDDMDIDCGAIISASTPLADKADEILDMILAVASGRATKSEMLGLGDNEFVPWQVGAVM